jgi:hypothetical protein
MSVTEMGVSSVVYAFVLLLLVDGALALNPNVTSYKVQRRELISSQGESEDDYAGGPHGQPFCDNYRENWTAWSTVTIQDQWAHIFGCSYESEVCATLSYELVDEEKDDLMDIMITKGEFCEPTNLIPFDDREHHIRIETPVSSSGTDLGLTASKAFCVIILCDNGYQEYPCNNIKFRMKIATQACQGAMSSSANTKFLLTVFLTIIPLFLLL